MFCPKAMAMAATTAATMATMSKTKAFADLPVEIPATESEPTLIFLLVASLPPLLAM